MSDPWYILNSGRARPDWNMAVDEILLAEAARTRRPVLRFYGWEHPAATFGYSQHYAAVASLTRLRPLIRRPTGGGLVPHDADWTYSVAIPPGHEWYRLSATASYQRIHDWLRRALDRCGLVTALAPAADPAGPGQCFVGAEKNDLLLGTGKLAGAAQRRNRQGLLIQGSLQPPPPTLDRHAWEQAMQQEGEVRLGRFDPWELPPEYLRAAEAAVAARYGSRTHNERR